MAKTLRVQALASEIRIPSKCKKAARTSAGYSYAWRCTAFSLSRMAKSSILRSSSFVSTSTVPSSPCGSELLSVLPRLEGVKRGLNLCAARDHDVDLNESGAAPPPPAAKPPYVSSLKARRDALTLLAL
eukprot:5452623-Pleurochrysis_carterae.AAC.1